jgi:hypothetical protein
LVVETNATDFAPSSVNLQNNGNARLAGFEPAPSPAIGHGLSVLLAVGGLLFGAKLFERSKRRHSLGIAAA